MISKLRFKAIARAFVSVPSDSDEQSSLRSALPLIFKLLAPMIFERCGSLADAELVRAWSNQELLSLSFPGGMVLLLSSSGPCFCLS